MSIGGALAYAISRRRRALQLAEKSFDPEQEEYLAQKKFIETNLLCEIHLFRNEIPPEGGKVEGMLVLEAKQADISHVGIFILMKGLPKLSKRRKEAMMVREGSRRTNVKFTVLSHPRSSDPEEWMVEGGVRETYPLDLDIPEELPPPLLTEEGKLIYKLEAFLSTPEGRHISVGETNVRWMAPRVVLDQERGKQISLEQTVETKRMWRVGPKKTGEMEWRVRRGGFRVGEKVVVELWGHTREKAGLEVECQVELIQKVFYQVPHGGSQQRLMLDFKINGVARAEGEGEVEEAKQRVWRGVLRIPNSVTATYTYDFTNSVSYVLKFGVGLRGESREGGGWMVGEVPVVVGTSLQVEDEEEEGADEEDDVVSPGSSLGSVPEYPQKLRENAAVEQQPVSRRRSFLPRLVSRNLPRRESTYSVQSLASSTLSLFSLPPSYSQLSSRRSSLDTLPPPSYSELELATFNSPDEEDEEDEDEPSSPGLFTTPEEEEGLRGN